MPLYEYECAACGKRFELIQKFSDPPQAACPHCGGRGERLLSAPAVHFKGSGFYATDYARKSAPAEKTETPSESKSESKTEGEKPAAASKKPAEKKPSSSD